MGTLNSILGGLAAGATIAAFAAYVYLYTDVFPQLSQMLTQDLVQALRALV